MNTSGDERAIGNPPGTEGPGPALRQEMSRALAAKGSGYVPRTRHCRDDGSPEYTNRLVLESSPYLQQHAHNPVNWYPWGEEAFETARSLNRPIFLSIGYSTCHWCHVMEEESFEDLEIAEFLNTYFIPVKVDRELRPDVDSIYMTAVQSLTGGGGWPLSVWMTPEGEPFFGGTYFPPRDGDRGAGTGFLSLLERIHDLHAKNPERVLEAAEELTRVVKSAINRGSGTGQKSDLTADPLHLANAFYSQRFDEQFGGLAGAPKFPSSLPIRFLLRYHRRTGNSEALGMAVTTLDAMAAGGMYDQVGGGFHRYSTDERWLVPHFEKMLYDNALLALSYLEGWQVTGNGSYADVCRETLDYIRREMTSPDGGFYSATDADSVTPSGHDEEGWFFTWTPDELVELLGQESADRVMAYHGVSEDGNFEGRSVLSRSRTPEELADEYGITLSEFRDRIARDHRVMYDARGKRLPPLRDDKILASWNGLMISAFARAGLGLDEPVYTETAGKAASFILSKMCVDGRLRHAFKDGRAGREGYLEDYAFLIAGLLDLHLAEHDTRWLERAVELQTILDSRFADSEQGGYYLTADDHEQLLAREKPDYDGAEPSGNSVAVLNLFRLNLITTQDHYRQEGEKALHSFSPILNKAPAAMSELLLALDFYLDKPKEIVLVEPEKGGDLSPFMGRLGSVFMPNMALFVLQEGTAPSPHDSLTPLVSGKTALNGQVTAYVCVNRTCDLPTTEPDSFAAQLKQVEPLDGPADSTP